MDISDSIRIAIEEIAKGLGVAVSYVYPILIKQAYVDGILALLLILTAIVLDIVTIRLMYKHKFNYLLQDDKQVKSLIENGIEESKAKSIVQNSRNNKDIIFSIFVFASIILTLMSISVMRECVTALVNPDYYIFEQIFDKIVNKTTS